MNNAERANVSSHIMNHQDAGETIAALTDQVISRTPISHDQAEWLVALGAEHTHDLFRAATRIREHVHGNRVRCCSIAAVKTGRCREDCAFCSQSKHFQTHVHPLAVLSPNEVFKAAMHAASNGASSFGVVNSGYGPTDKEIEYLAPTLDRIHQSGKLLLCASLGVLAQAQAHRLKQIGVQRYNHNLQTSRRFWTNIVKTHTYEERLATLGHLKKAGISLCCGALFGMGETWTDRLDLAYELRSIDPDVVPINFLIPIKGTPLENTKPLDPMECLKIIAIYRFLLPRQSIKIAGGRETNLRNLQSWIFYAGADGFLIGNYLTTAGREPQEDHRMIRDLGLEIDPVPEQAISPPPVESSSAIPAVGQRCEPTSVQHAS